MWEEIQRNGQSTHAVPGRNTGENVPLPVRNLLFLGKASEQKLLNQGIRTIGDLAREREANVQLWLGEKPEHR